MVQSFHNEYVFRLSKHPTSNSPYLTMYLRIKTTNNWRFKSEPRRLLSFSIQAGRRVVASMEWTLEHYPNAPSLGDLPGVQGTHYVKGTYPTTKVVAWYHCVYQIYVLSFIHRPPESSPQHLSPRFNRHFQPEALLKPPPLIS